MRSTETDTCSIYYCTLCGLMAFQYWNGVMCIINGHSDYHILWLCYVMQTWIVITLIHFWRSLKSELCRFGSELTIVTILIGPLQNQIFIHIWIEIHTIIKGKQSIYNIRLCVWCSLQGHYGQQPVTYRHRTHRSSHEKQIKPHNSGSVGKTLVFWPV